MNNRETEIASALSLWKRAMLRYENCYGEQSKVAIMEVEAAKNKYIYLLKKHKASIENQKV